MGKTVAELMSGTPQPLAALEELYWIALYSLSPWGEERDDLRFAHIVQMIHNTNVKKGQGKKLDKFVLFKNPWKEFDGMDADVMSVFSQFPRKK